MKKTLNKRRFSGLKKGMGMADVLNAIRSDAGEQYQLRVPKATRNNLAKVADGIVNYTPNMNEFIHNLINRIGLTVIKNKLYNNPLAEFKKGMLNYGESIQEIFVDIAKAVEYTPFPEDGNEADVFKITFPDVEERFHIVNREEQYPVTITRNEVRKAFVSYDSLESFVSKIFESLYTGANLDEFLIMKQLISEYKSAGNFAEVKVVEPTTEATSKDFAITLQEYCENLTFMSRDYNAANVMTHTPYEEQVILINPKYKSRLSVEVLAYAFNMSKADFLARVVTVDDFGSDTDDVVAVLVDKEWFMIYDFLFEMTDQFNAKHIYWNYFLQVQQVMSVSQFANAVIFTTADITPSVTSVTVTPATANMKAGATKTFKVEVDVLNGASDTVTYKLTGNKETTTVTDGVVKIGSDETVGTKIELTVTSTVDTTKSDVAIITIVE